MPMYLVRNIILYRILFSFFISTYRCIFIIDLLLVLLLCTTNTSTPKEIDPTLSKENYNNTPPKVTIMNPKGPSLTRFYSKYSNFLIFLSPKHHNANTSFAVSSPYSGTAPKSLSLATLSKAECPLFLDSK